MRCTGLAVGALLLSACGSTPAQLPAPSIAMVSPSSGPTSGGTAITIGGSSFQNGATVRIGPSTAAGVGFNSASSLAATTPPEAAGPADVTVTNPDGQSVVLPNGFTYLSTCTVPAAVTASLTLDSSCTWTAAATVLVGGPSSPVLTILPGTTVQFAPGANGLNGAALRVGADGQPGSLVANSSSGTDVILLTSASPSPAPGDWGGVLIGPQGGGSSLENVDINYAGGAGANDLPTTDAAALTVEGGDVVGGSASQSPAPSLNDVAVKATAGHGFVFAGVETGLGAPSAHLAVVEWEEGTHFPFVIEANEGGTIPTTISATGAVSPTPSAVVALKSYVANNCVVTASTTWPAITLPYLAVNTIQVVSQNPNSAPDTLTISAPNQVEFAPGIELDVDIPPPGSNASHGNSFLVANGTATEGIVFTSSDASPVPGAWGGINFWCTNANQNSGSSLSYATVAWASATQTTLTGTGEIAVLDGQATANGPLGPVISNCTFSNYGSTLYGITLFDVSNVTLNAYLSSNNSFATANTALQYCSGQITDGTCP